MARENASLRRQIEVLNKRCMGLEEEVARLEDEVCALKERDKIGRSVDYGFDISDISSAGWGVIFSEDEAPAVREALRPLLARRQASATKNSELLYREFCYYSGETKAQFLARNGAGPGPPDPQKIPYYLLVVGDPVKIPFHVQYQLDVQYAVGRLDFETPEDYHRYANSVVEVEESSMFGRSGLFLFGPENVADEASGYLNRYLIRPLLKTLTEQGDWEVKASIGSRATKKELHRVFSGAFRPALVFTASHGLEFSRGAAVQAERQGAILCSDWRGAYTKNSEVVSRDYYFAADDVGEDADLHGLVTFHFSCHSAGVSDVDISRRSRGRAVHSGTCRPFTSRLSRRLLSHPRGGSLAFVGRIDRAFTYSFLWPGAGQQIKTFEMTLQKLMEGHPVGDAMRCFDERYAEISAQITQQLELEDLGFRTDEMEIDKLWVANHDARNYIIIGDPAVRISR